MDAAAAFQRRQVRAETLPLVVALSHGCRCCFRFPRAMFAQSKPGFGRAALGPAGAVDNCSAKTLRKRLQTRGPIRLSSGRCVREANAFQLFHSFFNPEYLGTSIG